MIWAVGPPAAAGDTAAGVAGTVGAAGVAVEPNGATGSGTTATAVAGSASGRSDLVRAMSSRPWVSR